MLSHPFSTEFLLASSSFYTPCRSWLLAISLGFSWICRGTTASGKSQYRTASDSALCTYIYVFNFLCRDLQSLRNLGTIGTSLSCLGFSLSGLVTGGNVPRDTSRLVHRRHEKHGPITAVELDPDKHRRTGRQIPPWFVLPKRRAYDSRAHRQVTGFLKRTTHGKLLTLPLYLRLVHLRREKHGPTCSVFRIFLSEEPAGRLNSIPILESRHGTRETHILVVSRGSTCTHKQLDLL
ncbi:hypothetical protein EV421DRAFT_515811 [Armillaria borealis]|uniref:Uncharacterized protein n=1 Tax=Armillaria borealis TaxID=47425 RepID=A0AA39IUJ5_9AGAR|nr:hypothetical protein EV421DRAFT_515811 [Armillaria borealis]